MKVLLILALLILSNQSIANCSIYKYETFPYNTNDKTILYWSVGSVSATRTRTHRNGLLTLTAADFMSLIEQGTAKCVKPDNTLTNLTTELKKLFNERLKQAVDEIEKENGLLRRNITSSLSLQLDVIAAQLAALELQISSKAEKGIDDERLKAEINKISSSVKSIQDQLYKKK